MAQRGIAKFDLCKIYTYPHLYMIDLRLPHPPFPHQRKYHYNRVGYFHTTWRESRSSQCLPAGQFWQSISLACPVLAKDLPGVSILCMHFHSWHLFLVNIFRLRQLSMYLFVKIWKSKYFHLWHLSLLAHLCICIAMVVFRQTRGFQKGPGQLSGDAIVQRQGADAARTLQFLWFTHKIPSAK